VVDGSSVFLSLTPWGNKLLQNLAGQVLMLQYLLANYRAANRLFEGGVGGVLHRGRGLACTAPRKDVLDGGE